MPATCRYTDPAWSSPYPHIHSLSIFLNITLTSTPVSPKWTLYFRFSHKPCKRVSSPHTSYMSRPSHLLDFINRKILGEKYRSWRSSLYGFLHSSLTSSLLCPDIHLNSLFSHILSLRSSLIIYKLRSCVQHYAKPTNSTVIFCTVLCCILLYSTLLHCTLLYCAVVYCILL